GIGVSHRGAPGGEAKIALSDDHVARKHHAVLPILKLDPVGGVIHRLVRIEPGDPLRLRHRAERKRSHRRREKGGNERAHGTAAEGAAVGHRGGAYALGPKVKSLAHGTRSFPGTIRRRARPASARVRVSRSASILSAEKVPAGIAPSTPPEPINRLPGKSTDTPRAAIRYPSAAANVTVPSTSTSRLSI